MSALSPSVVERIRMRQQPCKCEEDQCCCGNCSISSSKAANLGRRPASRPLCALRSQTLGRDLRISSLREKNQAFLSVLSSFPSVNTPALPTSQLYLLDAHVHHHGTRGVVGLDQRGQVTAEHFFDPAQVRLAVTGNQFGALFVYIQATV